MVRLLETREGERNVSHPEGKVPFEKDWVDARCVKVAPLIIFNLVNYVLVSRKKNGSRPRSNFTRKQRLFKKIFVNDHKKLKCTLWQIGKGMWWELFCLYSYNTIFFVKEKFSFVSIGRISFTF